MKHSTVSEWRAISIPDSGVKKTQVVKSTLFTLLFSFFSIGFLNAQSSLSSDPNFVYHALNNGPAQPASFTDDSCENAPAISSSDWSIATTATCDAFEQAADWSIMIDGIAPANCINTVWTGGYCGTTAAVSTATQSLTIPNIAGLELGFEWFLLSLNGETGDKYSYISIDGTEVWTKAHFGSENSDAFETAYLDMSTYLGQTIEIELGNVNADGGDQGNVFFGCFAYVCSGCVPEIGIECPVDVTITCEADSDPINTGMPNVVVNDCVDGYDLDFSDDVISDDDVCPVVIARTFNASYLDLNAMCTQIITITDEVSPWFTSFPEDVVVECSMANSEEALGAYLDANVPFPTAEDNCSAVSFDVVWEYLTDFDCPVTGMCYKHITISDACGNSVTQSLTVTIIDTEGPVFESFEEEILVSCLEEVPGPQDLTAIDECSGLEIEVEIFESNTGELTDTCNLSTAVGPGDDWALWLPTAYAAGSVTSANFNFDANGGSFDQFADGTAHLYGTVVNDENSDESFDVNLWFQNKSGWADWSSMGRGYKDDLGCAQPNLYEDWTYYEMVGGISTAVGQGDLDGDVLYFYHMPANYYFGFQIGMGANNKNCDYGMSGWFTYEGLVDGAIVEGHGDVNVNAECGPVNEQECPNDTEFTYIYRAVDDCLNATIVDQVVTVLDETGPTFTVFPADLVVDCDEYPVAIGVVAAEDNCVGEVEIEGPVDVMESGDCPNEFTVFRRWTATDICGNSTDRIQTISVIDNEAPMFAGLPDDMTVQCDDLPEIAEVTVSDNCSDVDDIEFSYDSEIELGNCLGNYTIFRIWYAMDECGNVNDHVQVINVIDTTAPVFDAFEANIDMPCDDISYTVDLTAADNCGTVEVTFEDAASQEGCAGSIVRTYTATDDCGNFISVDQNITLIDGTAPYFTEFPADAIAECDNVPAVSTDLSYDDNCTMVTLNYDGVETIPGNCIGNYTLIRSWTITDACGNATSDSQTITVQDTTAPEFTFVPGDNEYSCEEEIPATNATAEDNCGTTTVNFTDAMIDGDCPNSYSIVRTFVATDDCGNSASAAQNIYVYDTTAPVFTEVQADMTLECDEDVPAAFASATDNCDLDVQIDVTDETIEGDCPNEYTLIRTYTATDNCMNSVSATQTIAVVDTTAPVFEDYEFYTHVDCQDVDGYTLEAIDNCGPSTVVIIEEILNSGGCMGVLYRVYEATDACGNTSSVEQYIVIDDNEAPELINVPADETLECDEVAILENGDYFFPGDVYGEDNCALEVEITYSEEILEDGDDCENSFILVRTWVGVDYCENDTTASQTITIVDTTAPEFIEFPADLTIECSDDYPAVEEPLASDNCDVDVTYELTEEIELGDCPGEETLSRIWRAFDNCGNVAMMTQTITKEDNTAPVFTYVPAAAIYECNVDIAEEMATAEDNCSIATVTFADGNFADGDCPQAYSFTRTFTAIDECGNSSTVTQLISVDDTTAPVFEEYSVQIEMPCDMIDGAILVVANDNCGEVVITYTDDQVSGGCAGVIIRDYTATDECGNTAAAQQIINLTDVVSPEFDNFPADDTVECDEVEGAVEGVTASDNCDDEVEVIYQGEVITPGACDGEYTITRSWLAIDNCLNETLETQTITVIDTTAPEFTFIPEGGEYSCDTDLPEVNAEAIDNCSGAAVTYADVTTPGLCPQSYSVTRTFTAIDGCGNAATESIEFNVYDLEAPVFTFVPADATVECDAPIPTDDATATDNCGEVTITSEDVVSTGGATSFDGCSADFRSELGFYSFGTPRVFEALDVTIGAGNELDMDDEIENLEGFTGGLSVNIDGSTLTVGTAETFDEGFADFEYLTVEITNMSCAGVSNVEVDSDLLLDPEGSPYTLTVDFTTNSITLTWEINEDGGFILITEGGESIFDLSGSISCIPENVITRTWTAVDQCGNEATASQVITIVDTTAPIFDAYETNISMPCDEIDDAILVSATDNCGDAIITYTDQEVSGGCAGVIIRDYIATDACGNTATAQQIINLTDVVAPELSGVPADAVVECGTDIPAPAMVTASDNCDMDLDIMFNESTVDNDCLYSIVRTWTVTDHCGNMDSATQTITIVDTQAPMFNAESEVQDVPCNADILITEPEASDICDENVDVVWTTENVDGDCANEYTAIHTFVATDDCGNTATMTITVNYIDEVAPEFTFVPSNLELPCDVAIPTTMATAEDNCGDVTMTFNDEIFEGECANAYMLERTWTATDMCNNSSTATTTYYIYDEVNPTFDQAVVDLNIECYGDLPAALVLTASDNCGLATVVGDSSEETNQCGNGVVTYSYIATDACGNTAEISYNVTINDITAPELSAEVEDLVVDCEDDAPDAVVLTATDNCDNNVEVVYTETIVGDVPAEGSTADCELFTPVSPYYNPDWSLWLQNFPNGDEFYTTIEANFVEFENGSAHLYGSVVSTENPEAGWDIDVWFMNGMDWENWSTQDFPTSFKDDFGISGGEHVNWTYYIVNADNATLTGFGDYEGSLLDLSHAPSSFFYGYQVGVAANNANGNYGNGGWFYYEGMIVEEGQEAYEVSGAGDFAFDADCCPRYEIVRTWTATDCSGNVTSVSQTVSFEDLGLSPITEGDANNINQSDAVESKGGSNVNIHSVYPNPAMERATFEFNVENDGKVLITIFNLSGQQVATIFNQDVKGGTTNKVEFEAGDIAEGVYLYQITNGDTVITDRLIIKK
jgi:hypothetical protein